MRVLVVHNYYQQPGGEDAVCEQERQLLERAGHQVLFYRRSNDEIENLTKWQRVGLSVNVIWNKGTQRAFRALLDRERPDVVHVHNTFVVISPSIFAACREAGVPVVQTVQNYRLFCPAATFFRDGGICEECLDHGLWHGVAHACYRQSHAATAVVALMLVVNRLRRTWPGGVDRIIAVTDFARRKMVEAGLPDGQVVVKPNFLYPDPGEGSGPRDYALCVGRLSPEKSVNTLLMAWSKLEESIPLLIAGGGPEREALEEQARRAGLTEVLFLGQVPRAKTVAAMQAARFLVFPSEWYEGFPVTICEALACGTPVICSRLGAMEEIVDNGRTGLHYVPGDAAELAAKVSWAWNHPVEVREMGRAARREFEAKYTAERNYPILMDIYEGVMARQQDAI